MDYFDDELAGMVNFTDETVPQQMPVMERKTAPKAEPKEEAPAKDASFEVLPQKKRSVIDKLYDMAKWLCVCGGISMLLWWFNVNGLMAMEAAYPCILACAVIGTAGATWSVK